MRLDGRIGPDRIAAPGAVVGDTLVWDGQRFKPGAGGDSDHPGLGDESTQVGLDAFAGDLRTAALGVNAQAQQSLSTALGAYTTAGGVESTALGQGATVNGTEATGVGSATLASQSRATAVGAGATANAANTTAIGTLSSASASRAVALGVAAGSFGADAIVVGTDSGISVSYPRAIVLGVNHNANAADRASIKANDLELVRSSAGTGTSIILADTSTGTRYRLAITGGALAITLA